jgi:hypothetical protein
MGLYQMETLTKCLIAAALMLQMPNAYAETQAASNVITAAAAISLYKILCRGQIPAAAVETVNTTIREYGESRVVASMVEMACSARSWATLPFAPTWKKSTSKNKRLFALKKRFRKRLKGLAHGQAGE